MDDFPAVVVVVVVEWMDAWMLVHPANRLEHGVLKNTKFLLPDPACTQDE